MGVWTYPPADPRSPSVVQVLAEPAPSTGTDGVNLSGVSSIVPVVSAESGQTFNGQGQFIAYVWYAAVGSWTRAPHADLDCSNLSGLSSGTLPTLTVDSPAGILQLIPHSVGVSGGATITTSYVSVLKANR